MRVARARRKKIKRQRETETSKSQRKDDDDGDHREETASGNADRRPEELLIAISAADEQRPRAAVNGVRRSVVRACSASAMAK